MKATTQQAVVKREERPMEFVPFGAKDTIKMSANIVRRLIAVPTASGKLPTDEDCIKFMMMCQAKRLNPFEQDAFMIGYDTKYGPKFSQITAHQAFLKRAELNQEYDGMESGVLVNRDEEIKELEGDFMLDDDILLGGWARVYFKNRSHPMTKRVKLSTFNKKQNQWESNPAGMIVKCAEADALRSSFPTMLGGLYIKEEMTVVSDPPKLAEPIFKSSEPEKPKLVEEIVGDTRQEKAERMLALAERDSIDISLLKEFMNQSGLLEDGVEPSDAEGENIDQVIERWDEFAKRMKEVDGV
jgi:phage recombination protein Bet